MSEGRGRTDNDSIGKIRFSSGFSAARFASSEERDFGANGLEKAESGLKDCAGSPRAFRNFMNETLMGTRFEQDIGVESDGVGRGWNMGERDGVIGDGRCGFAIG